MTGAQVVTQYCCISLREKLTTRTCADIMQ